MNRCKHPKLNEVIAKDPPLVTVTLDCPDCKQPIGFIGTLLRTRMSKLFESDSYTISKKTENNLKKHRVTYLGANIFESDAISDTHEMVLPETMIPITFYCDSCEKLTTHKLRRIKRWPNGIGISEDKYYKCTICNKEWIK